jgi:hypothetical protein
MDPESIGRVAKDALLLRRLFADVGEERSPYLLEAVHDSYKVIVRWVVGVFCLVCI